VILPLVAAIVYGGVNGVDAWFWLLVVVTVLAALVEVATS
jgi:type II secretory pathway component PulF